MTASLKDAIDAAFEQRQDIKPGQQGAVAEAVEQALALLDSGQARVAEKKDGAWVVNDWLKKAILLSFRLNEADLWAGGCQAPGGTRFPRNSRLDGGDVPIRRPPRGSRSRSASLRLYSARRCLDAVLHKRWRLCGRGHHGRHLVRSPPAPRSARIATSRAAWALAASWSRCRQVRSLSRTTASSVRARRSPKG